MGKILKIGDIKKWQGIRNSDTGQIEYGYLWFTTKIMGNEMLLRGRRVKGKNRSEAIKNFCLETKQEWEKSFYNLILNKK